jgi:hypothetical protein
MVRAEKTQAVGQKIFGSVREMVVRFAGDDAGLQEKSHVSVEGDLSEAYDDADAREGLDLLGEVGAAVANLLWERLVAGRGTTDDGGYPRVTELEAIVAGDSAGLAGKSEFVEDRIHEVAGAIAGEGAASAVGSVSTWGETEDQDSGSRIAEAWDGA